MSLRIDTTEWIAGSLVIGDVGLGVLGSEIPATGDHGAGYAYNDLDLPTDSNKEICGRITTWPSAGTLFAYEDTSFEFSGPDGTYSFQYQLYVDGVSTGSPVTVTLQIGAVTHATSGALSASVASISGASLRFVSHPTDGALSASIAQVSGSVTRIGGPSVYASAGELVAGVAQLSGVASRIAALVTHDTSGVLVATAAQVLGTAAGPALFSQEQLDFLLAYMQENLMIPTAEQIAAAVLAVMQTSNVPFPSNVTHFNGNPTQGSGQPNDPVRPL